MKANRHDNDIFSVCVLYTARGIFITIKDVEDKQRVSLL